MLYGHVIAAQTSDHVPCTSAPTITNCVASEVGLGTCPVDLPAPSNGWRTNATLSVSGSLQPGQEFYWEHNANRGGWGFVARTTGLTSPNYQDATIGSNGGGSQVERFSQWRAYVIPAGGSPGNACSGPVTSGELSKTAHLCS